MLYNVYATIAIPTYIMGWWGWEEIRTLRQNMREEAHITARK